MGILLCGLNGVGKSTVGQALARRLSYRFIDNEDLYFPKTDESYTYDSPRSKAEAIRILAEQIGDDGRFVFAAVKGDYGDLLLSRMDCAVLIEVPRETRLERVRQRSAQRFGDRILAGGDLAQREEAWFAQVDSRPEDYVVRWLETVGLPVICVDGTRPVEETVDELISVLGQKGY